MIWKPYTHHGQVFDLSHLYDFEHTYIQAATAKDSQKQFRVFISFTNHCFTDSYNQDGHLEPYQSGNSPRYFNAKRWQYSIQLPDMLKGLTRASVYVVHDNSYFSFKTIDDAGELIEYEVYFDVFFDKVTKQILLLVKSAYARDSESSQRPITNNANRVGFFTLLAAAKLGKRIHRRY